MSSSDDEEKPATNRAPDGSYVVGKNKPPESGKFRKGDGRKRGRRKKGTNNLATDFRDVMTATTTVTLNGKRVTMSRQRAIVMRLIDNASRGQSSAIKIVMAMGERLTPPSDEEDTLTIIYERATGSSIPSPDDAGDDEHTDREKDAE